MERRWYQLSLRKGINFGCVLLIAGLGSALMAQPAPPPPAGQTQQLLSPQALDDLVAPIALYPDPLLGQVLAAATYPVEVVEAQQWLQANGNLQGQALTDAARQQNWDASVQAMVAMPDVLAKLNQDVRWTTDLGNAFLAQPADVMAAVQRMRARAQANGKLQSGPQETVSTESQNGQQVIVIQPASPEVIYVPDYDPAWVWGPPVWGYYPALYYPSYGWGWYPGFNIGLCFGGWGGWCFGVGGFGWGWGMNWFGGGLFVNANFYNHYGYHYGYGFNRGFGEGRYGWVHDPGHRWGVGYPNRGLNERFGAASQAARISAARSGNFSRFGTTGGYRGSAGPNNSFRGGATPQAGRNLQNGAAGGGYQRFQQGRQTYQPPQNRTQPGTQQRFQQGNIQSGGQQRFQQGNIQGGGYQRFQQGRQTYQPPAQRNNAPSAGQRYNYSAPSTPRSYSAPSMPNRGYSAPSMPRSYSAPAQRYSAPSFNGGGARSFGGGGGSAPRSFGGGGGGGARSFGGGGGGGGARSFGGGGGGSRGGGGGHGGGGRR